MGARNASAAARVQTANWVPAEPAIPIAIPADSIFLPGSLPQGMNFTAELSLAEDGSARQLRLRPRLVGFEQGVNQP